MGSDRVGLAVCLYRMHDLLSTETAGEHAGSSGRERKRSAEVWENLRHDRSRGWCRSLEFHPSKTRRAEVSGALLSRARRPRFGLGLAVVEKPVSTRASLARHRARRCPETRRRAATATGQVRDKQESDPSQRKDNQLARLAQQNLAGAGWTLNRANLDSSSLLPFI